jgi:hypothetical protein
MIENSSYTVLVLQGITFSTLYFYIRGTKYSKSSGHCHYDMFLFMKFVLFYVVVQEIGRMFDVNRDVICLLFIGRLISLYLEVCDSTFDVVNNSCDAGMCMK